jgi:putative hemolysin
MRLSGFPAPERSANGPPESRVVLRRGRYTVSCAEDPDEIARAQALRALCFDIRAPDRDEWDGRCRHFLVTDLSHDRLVGVFRTLLLTPGEAAEASYAARFYDLAALTAFPGPILELGRFCVHPGVADPDVLRIAWGALARMVDDTDARLLMGCSSFPGLEAAPYRDCFALLRARHLAPARWAPRPRAPEIHRFAADTQSPFDPATGVSRMPSLLRSYLTMGGWVSDHAVVDREMNTLHVFTGVEIDAIPPARKALLRRIAGEDGSLRREYLGKDEAAR